MIRKSLLHLHQRKAVTLVETEIIDITNKHRLKSRHLEWEMKPSIKQMLRNNAKMVVHNV